MGNWSPYSEEWEKQHARKVIENTNAARIEFEKKPWASGQSLIAIKLQ